MPTTTEELEVKLVVLVLVGICSATPITAVVMECCCCISEEVEVKTLLEECTTASYSGELGSCKEEEVTTDEFTNDWDSKDCDTVEETAGAEYDNCSGKDSFWETSAVGEHEDSGMDERGKDDDVGMGSTS